MKTATMATRTTLPPMVPRLLLMPSRISLQIPSVQRPSPHRPQLRDGRRATLVSLLQKARPLWLPIIAERNVYSLPSFLLPGVLACLTQILILMTTMTFPFRPIRSPSSLISLRARSNVHASRSPPKSTPSFSEHSRIRLSSHTIALTRRQYCHGP